LHIKIFIYLCSPKGKCGEIWLLATTLKNAKMLTPVGLCSDLTIAMFCVFMTAPHSFGAFLLYSNQAIAF
jgi:hypothetical protein